MKFILVIIGLLSVGELLIEIVFWVRSRWINYQVRPHYPWSYTTTKGEFLTGLRGYLKLSAYPGVIYRNAPFQKCSQFKINSRGHRGDELVPSEYEKLIVLMGGSTVFGTGLDRDDQTIAAHLQSLIPHSQVVNAGVIGYQSGQELAYFVKDLIDLSPDLVIILNGWNDFSQILYTFGPWGSQTDRQLMGFIWFSETEAALLAHSRQRYGGLLRKVAYLFPTVFPHLAALVCQIGRKLRKHLTFRNSTGRYQNWLAGFDNPGPDADYFSEVLKSYVRNMTVLRDCATARSSRFLCIIQHSRNENTSANLYRQFSSKAAELLRVNGVPTLELANAEGTPGTDRFMDPIHLDAQGCLETAQVIHRYLKESDLMPKIKA